MTFSTKADEQREQQEQKQRDYNMAEALAIVSYTSHPGDDAQAAQSISRALPWSSHDSADFIERYGQRLREQADAIVAEASDRGITPRDVMALQASANAAGITLDEAAAQKAERAATAASAAKDAAPVPLATRAAIAAIAGYATRPDDNTYAATQIVWLVSGWSVLQADTFIREYSQRLQALAGDVRAIATAAERSSAMQSAQMMKH